MARILVIDDAPEIRALAGIYLIQDGHGVITEGNPQVALQLLSHWDFDLIVLDIEMPEMSGLDFAEVVTQKMHNKRPLILFHTTNSNQKTVEVAARFQPDGYLLKPMDKHMFKQKVASALSGRYSKTQIPLFLDQNRTGLYANVVEKTPIQLIRVSDTNFVFKSQTCFPLGSKISLETSFLKGLGLQDLGSEVLYVEKYDTYWLIHTQLASPLAGSLKVLKTWLEANKKSEFLPDKLKNC